MTILTVYVLSRIFKINNNKKNKFRKINKSMKNDININNVWKYSTEERLRFYTSYPKSLESSFSMTGMHQRWYRCEAKSHTLAVAHMHWCTRDGCSGRYTWLCIHNRSAVVPIVSRRRDAAELEEPWWNSKSSISSIDLFQIRCTNSIPSLKEIWLGIVDPKGNRSTLHYSI